MAADSAPWLSFGGKSIWVEGGSWTLLKLKQMYAAPLTETKMATGERKTKSQLPNPPFLMDASARSRVSGGNGDLEHAAEAINVGCLHSIEPEEDTDVKDPPDMISDLTPSDTEAEKNESGGGERGGGSHTGS